MFSSDFQWSDILLGHYLFSVFAGFVLIIITYIISKKYNFQTSLNGNMGPVICDPNDSDVLESDNTTNMCSSTIKKSPALEAEKVIQANMTEEQRKLEYEVRQKQLAQIYELMMKQSDKFGKISLSDVEEQMKLYQDKMDIKVGTENA